MPLPSKQNDLFEQVLQDIRIHYYPGAILPSEPAYARNFGCSRSTLRKVLDRLQQEKKISRTHSGTFVLDEKTGKCSRFNMAEHPVYMLLPCADYGEQIDSVSLQLTREFFDGARRGVIETGRQIVTLPVSESNRDNQVECVDFAWSQVSILRKNDIVLFLGRWYNRLLSILERNECRIGFISQLPDPFPCLRESITGYAGYIGYSNWAFIRQAAELLMRRGKKRIGCLWFFLEEEEHRNVDQKFRALLRKEKADGRICGIPFHSSPEEKYLFFKQFLAQYPADALVISPHLRNAPWPAGTEKLLKNLTIVVDSDEIGIFPSAGQELVIGRALIAESAKNIVQRLIRDPNSRKAELYPYEFIFPSGEHFL